MRVAEAAAAYKEASKEGDEVGEALFGETEDEVVDNAGSDESPLRWRRRPAAPTTPCSADVPQRQQRGRGHRRLRRGPAPPTMRQRTSPAQPRPHPAGNVGEDFHRSAEAPPAGNKTEDNAGSAEAPPRCQRGRATQKTRKSRTR